MLTIKSVWKMTHINVKTHKDTFSHPDRRDVHNLSGRRQILGLKSNLADLGPEMLS